MDKLVFSGKVITPELTDMFSAGGRVSLVVTGTSMTPFLRHGRDAVVCRAWEDKDLKCGQILLFQRPDQTLILHRIRKVLPDGKLLINGDGQAWCETISANQILAVVSVVERKGRHMSCDSFGFKVWNWLWYPTRPIRPVLLKLWRVLFSRKKRDNRASG